MVFNERIVALREKKGITQKQCAADLQVDYTKYNRWERGAYRPDYEMLVKMADYFDCTTDYLLGVSSVPTFDHSDIAARTGLSEGAIAALEHFMDLGGLKNSHTAAVNALLESYMNGNNFGRTVIDHLSHYLYYNMIKIDNVPVTKDGNPFQMVATAYRYGNGEKNGIDTTTTRTINNENYKYMLLYSILDALKNLRDTEESKSRF